MPELKRNRTAHPPAVAPVAFRVSRVARALRKVWSDRIEGLGVSPPQAAVLRALLHQEKIGVRALARTLATDPMNVKHLVDRLEAEGLSASDMDPGDRRTRCLHLTDRGRTLALELERLGDQHERWLGERLGPDALQALTEALTALEGAAGIADGGGSDHGPSAWDQRHRERPFSSDPDPLVMAVAADLPPGRALDLGCGAGRNSIGLAEAGWEVTGVDFSAVALEQLGRAARERSVVVTTVRSDLLTYQPEPNNFDLCVVANIHLPEPDLAEVLRRAASGLREGGRLLLLGHHVEGRSSHGPRSAGLLFSEERAARLLPEGLVVERLERHRREHGGDLAGVEDLSLLLLARRAPGG